MNSRFPTFSVCYRLMLVIGSALGLLLSAPVAQSESNENAARDAKIMTVLDQFMDGLNALDIETHMATYQFPHFRYASGTIAIWNTPLEANPILGASEFERRTQLRKVLGPEWHKSVWTRRDIVQGDAEKVHVATTFVRQRKDGSTIKTYESLYVMTKREGRWGIKGRSSFAP